MISLLVTACIRALAGTTARWEGCAPEPRQRVFFANHTSNLDGPVLWLALPESLRAMTRLVAARDYWSANGVRRYLAARVFNAILIERKNVTVSSNPLPQLIAALDAGHSLIIFPEGGRSLDGDVLPFKSGIYHLARKRPAVEFVPVYIDNMNRILPKGEFLPVPLLSCVTYGTPIRLGDDEARDAFLERARNGLMNLRRTRHT